MRKPTRQRLAVLTGVLAGGLLLTACADDGGTSSASGDGGACSPEDVTLIGQVRNQTNPYEAAWLSGGDEFAESVGLEQQHLTYDGDSQRQQEQIRQALAGSGMECAVLNVLPNGDSDTAPIVAAANEAGAYLVTQWNKPADLNPWDGYDRWVSHITYDGEESGYLIAKALFESMGGSGGVIALQGILDTSAAQDRFAGLQRALSEHPEIELLDEQTAGFDRAEALNVTRTLLTAHGEHVGGVWAANDDMALGAMQALEAAGATGVGVVGIDAVPEAIAAIEAGTMTATVSSDGPWQGAIGLAMGYCAATGELDVADVANDDRAFFAEQFLIDQTNAAEFAEPELNLDDVDCANLFTRATGPIG
ncbi:sugar ABC transporter substrate-binding protein [Jiangella mangrovi]|uniref:Ribose transport system substrate-binding protein n=1 Tax=Jiangella mangrovi TaxID=1524084 RepID=A0A7W9GVI4_9ACTN|nr:sugar ABC transporter substrate-binding protein [Jiangella mangrovi]MBB5790805.1 ribose transport system substrate-binding protein [Jiangella mangrovi]